MIKLFDLILSYYRKMIGFFGLLFMGALSSSIRLFFDKYGVEFNRKILAPNLCEFILFLLGVKVDNRMKHYKQSKGTIYFFNHNSFLDIFIIPILALGETRFIISEVTKSIIPLHLCNLGVDVLYIPVKSDRERRKDFFKKITDDLKNMKYSVICSPEGQHTFKHHIAPFNKGVFNMAMLSKRPIQNLFFNIPREANPLESINMYACTIEVYAKEFVLTDTWSEESLDSNCSMVRSLFLKYYKETYGDYGESDTQCHFS